MAEHQNCTTAVQEAKGGVPWATETISKAHGTIFKGSECLKGKLWLEVDSTGEPVCLQ